MELADEIVDKVCDAAGFINRGPKKRTDLKFLNAIEEISALVEGCFVDAKPDCDLYRKEFENICGPLRPALPAMTSRRSRTGIRAGARGRPVPRRRHLLDLRRPPGHRRFGERGLGLHLRF